MGKINRLGEASHVTTIVGDSGNPEVVDLVPENQLGTEQVEYDEDGNRLDRVDDVEPEDEEDDADDESVAGVDDATTGSEGLAATFEATGSADVVAGEQPPVDKSIAEVQAWVGDDWVKAERALVAEKAGRNRSGLVTWLEKVVAAK